VGKRKDRAESEVKVSGELGWGKNFDARRGMFQY